MLCSVLDDNDNVPEFMQASFQLSLPENLPPGVIHTSQASDPDHGANGTITYAIQGEIPKWSTSVFQWKITWWFQQDLF